MPPGQSDLTLYQGDDFLLQIVFTVPGGGPMDLTGYTFTAQIRPVSADADEPDTAPLVEGTCQVVDAEAGMVTVLITHADTETLPTPKPLRWDLESVDGNGWVTTFLAGRVAVIPEVTRV